MRSLGLLPLLLLLACGDGLETKEETDALGFRTVYQVDPETGLQEGEKQVFDPRGYQIESSFYAAGELDGERRLLNPDGSPSVVETYVAGRFEGPYQAYDSIGNLLLRGEYSNGAMNKVWEAYYPNGGLKEVVTFVENEENGPFREWYDDGQPKASGNYRNGDNEDGTLHIYATDGSLERVLECDAGRCQTVWIPDSTATPPPGPDMILPD